MTALLGKAGPKELALAVLFGAASSSCSYATASMTKTLFRKGAHIVSALAFLPASTNLVLELSIVLWIFLGWQFVLAEFVGGGHPCDHDGNTDASLWSNRRLSEKTG